MAVIDGMLKLVTGNLVRQSFLLHLANEAEERWQKYRELREYYEGNHETQLNDRMRKYLSIKANTEFSANYMPIVVDSMSNRLIVSSFEAGGQSEQLWDWWVINNMDLHQGNVHTAAIRDGDTYVLVSWDEELGRPVFTPQLAYDGRYGAHVYYSDEDNKMEGATKRWNVERGEEAGIKRRMNMYLNDRIIEFQSGQEEFDGDWQQIGVHEWVPGMIPVSHFKNRGRGYRYGMSEMDQAIPMQNALNKSVIALLASADTSGFRLITWIGNEVPDIEVAPGVILWDENPDTKIGWIQGEDLRPMIETVDSFVQRIGQVSDTPLSYFQLSGQMASEGTHKQHESRMIAKCRVASIEYGTSWEQCMTIARRLFNVFGGGTMDETQRIHTTWADFEIRDIEAHLTEKFARLKMAADGGLNLKAAAIAAGFTEEEATELAKVDPLYAQRIAPVVERPDTG